MPLFIGKFTIVSLFIGKFEVVCDAINIIVLDKREYQEIFFLFQPQNHMLGYSLEAPR